MTRKFYLDILRISAIFGVILIHVASQKYNLYAQLPLAEWLPYNIYHSISRWCVPVFFMMSGALLLPKQEGVKTFFTKRYSRLVIAFLFWQIFYFWFFKHAPDLRTSQGWYDLLFGREAGYHLWFMNAILQVYLLIPFLQRLVQKIPQKLILYAILVWLIPTAGLRLFQLLTGVEILGYHLQERYLLDYGGFLLLGYYLDQIKLKKKYNLPLLGIILICSALVIILKTIWHGSVHSYADSNLSLHLIILGGAIFLWYKNQEEFFAKILNQRKIARLLKNLAHCSFGIYLLHLVILTWCQKNSYLDGSWPNGWLGVPLISLGIFLVCWLVIAIWSKIPVLKRLVT